MPVIAITPCSKQHDYEEAVRRAGGDVRILSYDTDRPADVVKEVDGILLPGGDDVLPSVYGAAAHPKFEAAEPGRDDYELELARQAATANVPLFAICRGIQVLNVARGGTLVQDIPSEWPNALTHSQKEPRDQPTHTVKVMGEGTRLGRILDAGEVEVNSMHHQAIKRLGHGLREVAWAPDGIIEGVEMPGDERFVVGVQWHPEELVGRDRAARNLFDAIVEAARRRPRH